MVDCCRQEEWIKTHNSTSKCCFRTVDKVDNCCGAIVIVVVLDFDYVYVLACDCDPELGDDVKAVKFIALPKYAVGIPKVQETIHES